MDDRDLTIVTQVAFKEACAAERDIDFTDAEGQARFEQVFSFLTESLVNAIHSGQDPSQQVARVIQGQFPGSQLVQQDQYVPSQQNDSYNPPAHTTPAPPQYGLRVKGTQTAPLPDWLFEQAAAKGVNEVYDNRDRAQGTKRPWFKATTGGDNAAAFWPPR